MTSRLDPYLDRGQAREALDLYGGTITVSLGGDVPWLVNTTSV